jgi:UDP-3-O-[3-hydroxymyristoyl] glucosamine N-acyltransferase
MELNLQLSQLLRVLDNVIQCEGDESIMIRRLSSLPHATIDDTAIVLPRGDASVFDPISAEAIKQSKAGVLIVQGTAIPGRSCVVVKDALAAFNKIVSFVENQRALQNSAPHIASTAIIHPTAVISSGAVIGEGAHIGPFVFIGKDCNIGANVVLYPGVKVLDCCCIGDHSIIHAGAVIGSDGFGYQISKTGLQKIPQVGIVRVGIHVEIGANSTLDRAAFDETTIGDGVKIDNSVHIAHNVKVGAHTVILAQTGIAGSVQIGTGCQIGGQVAIRDHLVIGNNVKIVSKSAVISSLKDGDVVGGIPAIAFGQWKRLMVCLQKLPDIIKKYDERRTKKHGLRSWLQRLWG